MLQFRATDGGGAFVGMLDFTAALPPNRISCIVNAADQRGGYISHGEIVEIRGAGLEVLEILTIATLRKKGMSLQTIKVVLRVFRRQLGQLEKEEVGQPALYVLTDGKAVYLEEQPERVVNRLSKARSGMYLVCLGDLIRVMTSKKFPQRYLTKQLPLF